MLNLLYCLDQNYNLQTLVSMVSFLNNTKGKINFFVIHENKDTFQKYVNYIKNHENCNSITIFEFENDNLIYYPNLINSHVSIATYFRLHLQSYIQKDNNFITYVDSDVICVSDPYNLIKSQEREIFKRNKIISASTSNIKFDGLFSVDQINQLELKNSKYFNAGVMIISLHNWYENNVSEELINLLIENKNEITFWDQDVLNLYFDGDYIELPKSLNHEIYLEKDNKEISKDTLLVHFSGSFKPWTARAGTKKNANIYHYNFLKIFKKYHITHTWKISSLRNLIISLFTLKVLNLQNPIKYIYNFILTLLNDDIYRIKYE